MDVDLLVSRLVSPGDVDEIEQAFSDVGLRPTPHMVAPRRGPEELSWLVVAALPLSSFLTSLGAKMAEDSYKALRQLTRRVLTTTSGAKPLTLVLEDLASGTQVVLESDLPDDSYRTLLAADFAGHAGGRIHYDRGRGQWVGSEDG